MNARCSKYDFWNLGEIWDRNRWPKKCWAKNVSSKKIWKLFGRKFLGPNIFDFWSKKIVEKVNENSKFWKFDFFSKFFEISKIWIFIDVFNEKNSGKNWQLLVQKNVDQQFSDFFRRKMFRHFFSDHLFRSQMIPRFRKSYLEQRATIIKIRIVHTKKRFFINLKHWEPCSGVDPLSWHAYSGCWLCLVLGCTRPFRLRF